MKKYPSLFLLITLLSWKSIGIASGTPPEVFTVKGVIKGIDTGKAFLYHIENNRFVIDSANIVHGRFFIHGTNPSPQRYSFNIRANTAIGSDQSGSHTWYGPYLFIESGATITISADINKAGEAIITGSSLDDVYDRYFKVLRPAIIKKQATIFDQQYAASHNGQSALPLADQQKFDAKYRAIAAEDSVATAAYIKAHAGSPASAAIVYNRYTIYKEEAKAEAFFNLLSPSVRESYYGQLVKNRIDLHNRTSVGNKVHDFTMNDTAGHAISLSSFKGRYVLIDFWASWCGPCRKENPNVVAAYNKYKDRNFTILGVSLDRPNGKAAWIKAIHDDGLFWNQVSDLNYFDNAAARLFGVNGIPANFLVDPSGTLVATNLRGPALDSTLATLLK